jgi:ribosome-binding protein aMBF1 (putative translation factor)
MDLRVAPLRRLARRDEHEWADSLTRTRAEKYISLMGRRIRRAREAKLMTQGTLAARAAITRRYVVELEAGRHDPTVGVLRRIAKALGLKPSQLID